MSKSEPEGKTELKESERAWIAYRDAQAKIERYEALGGDKRTLGPVVYGLGFGGVGIVPMLLTGTVILVATGWVCALRMHKPIESEI